MTDPTPADPGTDPEDTETEPESPNKEAAKYRVRAREAETQRDALAARVEALQRVEILRLAGEQLATAEDFFAVGGGTVADVLNEAGDVVPELVLTRVHSLLETRPGLSVNVPQRRTGPSPTGQGRQGGTTQAQPTWSDVLKNR